MTKKPTSKIIKKDSKSGKFIKGHKRSAHDGFSMEIPPKKPIITKPRNEDEKKD